MSVRRVPGTALANAAAGEVIYTPPATEEGIRKLLGNWECFLLGKDRWTTQPLDLATRRIHCD